MPVIGHTFAGIVIAQEFEPAGPRNPRPVGPTAHALWIPALVGLSYLPDVVTQIGLWMGYRSAQEAGHSIVLGIVAGVILGAAWAWASGASVRVLTALSVGSIVLHDALDLLQDGKRMPFWPLSEHRMGVEWLALSDRLWWELVVFGLPFAIYEIWRFMSLRRRAPIAVAPAPALFGLDALSCSQWRSRRSPCSSCAASAVGRWAARRRSFARESSPRR
jgi:membrane-bound metal-dependent hydrolase YbcI (DUF457 family)